MPKTTDTADIIEAITWLHQEGAKYVYLQPDGKAPDHPANARRGMYEGPPLNEVLEHHRSGGRLGIEPHSLGCAVVDIDGARPNLVEGQVNDPAHNELTAKTITAWLGDTGIVGRFPSLSAVRKQSGKSHLWVQFVPGAQNPLGVNRDGERRMNGHGKMRTPDQADGWFDVKMEHNYVDVNHYLIPLAESVSDADPNVGNPKLAQLIRWGEEYDPTLNAKFETAQRPALSGPVQMITGKRAAVLRESMLKKWPAPKKGSRHITVRAWGRIAGGSERWLEGVVDHVRRLAIGLPAAKLKQLEKAIEEGRAKPMAPPPDNFTGSRREWTQYESQEQPPIEAYAQDADAAPEPDTFGDGAFEVNLPGFQAALAHCECNLRMDVRSGAAQWKIGDNEWQPDSPELAMHVLHALLAERCDTLQPWSEKTPVKKGYKIGRRLFEEFQLATLQQRQYDPFSDYLGGLPAWDRKPRIDTILIELLGAKDTKLNRFGSSMVLLQAARYVTHPGFKCDESLLIAGPTGIGKSSVYQLALPESIRGAGFTDKPRFDMTAKELAEALESGVIVEFAETDLGGRNGAQTKRWLTSRDDGGMRMAYGRKRVTRPRRGTFYATADKRECMSSDPAMVRRFVPVWVEGGVDYAEMLSWWNEHRDQCWAEAVTRAKLGDPFLPQALRAAQIVAAAHLKGDWTSLHDRIEPRSSQLNGRSLADIRWILKLDNPPVVSDADLKAALQDCGFTTMGRKQAKTPYGKMRPYRPWALRGWRPPESFEFEFVRDRETAKLASADDPAELFE